MCPKSMKLKQKWSKSNDYSSKCCFYWVITWKLLLSGRDDKNLVGGGSLLGGIFSRWDGGERAKFWLVGGTLPPFSPVGKTLIYLLYIYIYIYIYALNLFIKHSGEHWWEQKEFCSLTTPQAFWQSLAKHLVLWSLWWHQLFSTP